MDDDLDDFIRLPSRLSAEPLAQRWPTTKNSPVKEPTSQVVMRTLESGRQSIGAAIKAGAPHLIVLFHDINNTTAVSIGTYIDTITAAAMAAGRAPAFTASTKAVMDVFLATKV